MAKRSPILGYNHNVRYRGLVFHVQTEDSGLLSPHLFTHLFHGGVIVSTRKLVYDPGANEEAIKALMQAQHKAVMKDLKKGAFDDKIDQYLGDNPELEKRQGGARPSTPELAAKAPASENERTTPIPLEILTAGDQSVPIELTVPKARTQTAQKASKPSQVRSSLAAPALQDDTTGTIADAVAEANAVGRAPTQLAQPKHVTVMPAGKRLNTSDLEALAELERQDDKSGRSRMPRDTAADLSVDVTVPTRRPPTGDRAASAVAASLPPVAKPSSRPGMTPPQVVARPLTPVVDESSGAVEIHAPAPPSAEPPPGERAERPGQYSVGRNRKQSENLNLREKTGRIAAVPGSALPPRADQSNKTRAKPPSEPAPTTGVPIRDSERHRAQTPIAGSRTGTPSRPVEQMRPLPRPETPAPAPGQVRAASPNPGGIPQPIRTPQTTAPIANRHVQGNPNVVMTRPAVIVGAPPKPPTPAAPPRVRKAREDEGRGFGQGLISEKSLDEVILAYLSEDADDK